MGQLINFCAGAELKILPANRVNALLFNVPDNGGRESDIRNTLKIIKAAKSNIVMLDSGGYQLLEAENLQKKITIDSSKPVIRTQSEINLAPWHVMQAAARLKPDFAVCLDFPILNIPDPIGQKFEFERKLGFNSTWALECLGLKNQFCPDVKLLLPIQCDSIDQLAIFLNFIGGTENFEGVSMPIRGMSINQIALFFARFYQLNIRRAHILGTSKFYVIALCAYMARHYFDWVSFDATTWSEFAKNAIYMHPCDLKSIKLGSRIIVDENIINDCICPFCRDKTFTYIKNLPHTEKGALLKGHNWWVLEKATRDLYENCGSVIELRNYLKGKSRELDKVEELCRALSIVDALKGSDIGLLQCALG
jgi:queuine/archaeosine tRNA-ribosyltransferase